MKQKFLMITVTLIGLMLGMLIIFADDRGMVIDDIVTETGTPAWEYALLTYVLFMSGGVILEMALSTGKYDSNRMIMNGIGIIVSVFILQLAVSSTTGDISTAFTSMQNEFYEWYSYIAVVVIVYITHMFYHRS